MRALIILISLLFFTIVGYSQTVIKMKKEGGVSVIPCKVNGLNLSFIFDTGAGDVSISMTEASFMLKNDYLSPDDIEGSQQYLDANGNITEGIKIILKEVEIAGLKLFNVEASIVKNLKAPLLLGQSAISKLGKIQLDLQSNTLTILEGNNSYDYSMKENVPSKPIFKIGQEYNGGTIFYIDGTGVHGLIVYDKRIYVAPDRGAIGTWNEAKNVCRNLGEGWRLPSKDELNILRLNKNVLKPIMQYTSTGQPIGSGEDGIRWSSTGCDAYSAWTIDFSDGEMVCEDKGSWIGIRVIKSF